MKVLWVLFLFILSFDAHWLSVSLPLLSFTVIYLFSSCHYHSPSSFHHNSTLIALHMAATFSKTHSWLLWKRPSCFPFPLHQNERKMIKRPGAVKTWKLSGVNCFLSAKLSLSLHLSRAFPRGVKVSVFVCLSVCDWGKRWVCVWERLECGAS